MERFAGGEVIPVSQTIFAWQNLALVAVLLVIVPVINRLMMPKPGEDIITIEAAAVDELTTGEEEQRHARTPAERLENSRILSILIGIIGVIFIVRFFTGGGRIGFNILNFMFLITGIILHGTPIGYVRAVNRAVRTCGGIILQFPIYAGIMGMMINSGLAVTLSEIFVNISNERTLNLFTYLSAGLVNFFVPSGGGQWAVQGPIMIPAAQSLGVSNSATAMAIAWGDAWTNLVQPFWALPLLAVARLRIRDIMGYTTVVLIFSGIVTVLFMLFVF
jgi:short-chain fatty acids transporter